MHLHSRYLLKHQKWLVLFVVGFCVHLPYQVAQAAPASSLNTTAPASDASSSASPTTSPTPSSAATPTSGSDLNSATLSMPAVPALGHSAQTPAAFVAGASAQTTDLTANAWRTLAKRQKQALAPLAGEWHELTAQQKQKWLTLAGNFFELSDDEQVTMHGRMRDWAALSPRQRSQARFHFSSTQSLAVEDKRAQWEAYLALSDQEKKTLSSGPKAPAKSAARSIAPANSRLVRPPLLPASAQPALLHIAPARPVHPKTLLPAPT